MKQRRTTSVLLATALVVSGVTVIAPAQAGTTGIDVVSTVPTLGNQRHLGLSGVSGLSGSIGVVRGSLLAAKSPKPAVTVKHSSALLRKGESIRLVIKAVGSDGKALAKKNARVQYRASSSKSWKTLGSKPTSKSGKTTIYWRAAKSGQYRVAVTPKSGASAIASKTIKVSIKAGNRTLGQRAKIAKNEIGSPTSGIKKLSKSQLKAKAPNSKSVQYRNYKSATLVKVVKTSRTKTWIVRGAINTLYRKAGGPSGTYGVPTSDAKCGLIESGCVQRFSKGTIYSSSYKSAATGVKIVGTKGEIAAAATSQVGYKKKWSQNPVRHTTKYNKWAGSSWHWCSMFVFWSADASGNASTIPEKYRIGNFVKWTKNNWTTTHTKPKVGDVGFIDTMGAGYPTHASIVVGVKGNQITTIEGNTARQFPTGYRGVSKQTRVVSGFEFFARPNY
jgi:hypothetical protein